MILDTPTTIALCKTRMAPYVNILHKYVAIMAAHFLKTTHLDLKILTEVHSLFGVNYVVFTIKNGL